MKIWESFPDFSGTPTERNEWGGYCVNSKLFDIQVDGSLRYWNLDYKFKISTMYDMIWY